jgi:asparagine synthase (glutamine-hydrolysing)
VKRLAYPLMNRLFPQKYSYRSNELQDWLRYVSYFDKESRSSLLKKDLLQVANDEHRTRLEGSFKHVAGHYRKAQHLDIHTYLPDDILNKVDIAGMMHSLEARTPLVDIRVAEYAAQLPEDMNIVKENGKWQGKYLLKKLLRKNYTDEFVYRRKMGFEVPLKKWFPKTKNGEGEMAARLLDRQQVFHSLFNQKELEHVATSDDSRKQWLLLFLQEWLTMK